MLINLAPGVWVNPASVASVIDEDDGATVYLACDDEPLNLPDFNADAVAAAINAALDVPPPYDPEAGGAA